MAGDVDPGLVTADHHEPALTRAPCLGRGRVIGQRAAGDARLARVGELAAGPHERPGAHRAVPALHLEPVVDNPDGGDLGLAEHGQPEVLGYALQVLRILRTVRVVDAEAVGRRGLRVHRVEVGRAEPVARERRRQEGLVLRPVQERLSDLPAFEDAEGQVLHRVECECRADAGRARADHEGVECLRGGSHGCAFPDER